MRITPYSIMVGYLGIEHSECNKVQNLEDIIPSDWNV